MKIWTREDVVNSKDGTVDSSSPIFLNQLDERVYNHEGFLRRAHYAPLYPGSTVTPKLVIVIMDKRSRQEGSTGYNIP